MIKNILCKKNGGIMDFREINTFIHVANQESFSKAADVLGYTQAAVSIQIKQLESELGTRLFDRIGKHISLTHQGKYFISMLCTSPMRSKKQRMYSPDPRI